MQNGREVLSKVRILSVFTKILTGFIKITTVFDKITAGLGGFITMGLISPEKFVPLQAE